MSNGSELIGRLRLEGAQAFVSTVKRAGEAWDQLRESAIRAGEKITMVTEKAAVGMEFLGDKTKEAGHKLFDGLAEGIAGMAAAAGAGSLFELGKSAIEASANMEQLTIVMTNLVGGVDKATAKLEFMHKLAKVTPFTFQQLAQAGLRAQGVGLNLEKVLPSAAALAVGSNTGSEGLMSIMDMLSRMANEHMPREEEMNRFGLSIPQFKNKGLRFDRDGELISTGKDTLAAFAKVVDDKYPDILNKMANTTNSKLATMKDRWEEVLVKIGDALTKILGPALDKLSKMLEKLTGSADFTKWLDNIGPNILRMIALVFELAGAWFTVKAAVSAAFKDWPEAILSTILAAVAFGASGAAKDEAAKLEDRGKQRDAALAINKSFDPFAVWDHQNSDKAPVAPPGMEYAADGSALNSIARTNQAIERNTAQMVDLKKYALGGGELGQWRVTPVEMYGGTGQSASLHINLSRHAGAMETVLHDAVAEVLVGAQRQGWNLRATGN